MTLTTVAQYLWQTSTVIGNRLSIGTVSGPRLRAAYTGGKRAPSQQQMNTDGLMVPLVQAIMLAYLRIETPRCFFVMVEYSS